jgi:hypothetical protein
MATSTLRHGASIVNLVKEGESDFNTLVKRQQSALAERRCRDGAQRCLPAAGWLCPYRAHGRFVGLPVSVGLPAGLVLVDLQEEMLAAGINCGK